MNYNEQLCHTFQTSHDAMLKAFLNLAGRGGGRVDVSVDGGNELPLEQVWELNMNTTATPVSLGSAVSSTPVEMFVVEL